MKKHSIAHCIGILLLVGLSACVHHSGTLPSEYGISQTPIASGETFLRTELFFGMSIAAAPGHPAGVVSEVQWQEFVDTWISPRFPNGLTVIDGNGQWLGKDGAPVKEHSKLLVLLHPASSPDEWGQADHAIEEIRKAYCRIFHQEAVLRVTSRAIVSF